jgi:hypothetical protein
MADLPSGPLVKLNDIEVDQLKPLSEALMSKIGVNINGLIASLIKVNYYTSSSTFTTPSFLALNYAILFGGGGGGGGGGGCQRSAGSPGYATGGGGGAGGSFGWRIVPIAISTGYGVTIGPGGTSGAGGVSSGSNGGTGGTTSFGSLASFAGGGGGRGGVQDGNSATSFIPPQGGIARAGFANGGAAGTENTSNLNEQLAIAGESGPYASGGSPGAYEGAGGGGGAGIGNGGNGGDGGLIANATNGSNGSGLCSGGGGGGYVNIAAGKNGGVGAPGFLYVIYF